MKKRLINLRNSPLLKNLIQVIGGNSAAQLLVVLAAPVITRIYSPEVFGLQGVFLAAVSLFAPLVALRYPMAIVLGRSNREIRRAEQASLVVAFITCMSLLLLLLFFREPLSAALGLDGLGLLILFIPLMLFFTGMQEIASYRAARLSQFRQLSLVTALQALIINGSRIIGGLLQPVASMLVVISTTGPAIHVGLLKGMTRKRRRTKRAPIEAPRSLWRFYKENKDFPLFRAPADSLNAALHALPVLLLTGLAGPAIAGFYTLARSVLNLPTNVIGNAIGKVYYAHFADKARDHQPLFYSALKHTLALFLAPGLLLIIVCLFAPQLFAIIFGSEWREAGSYAQWMSIWVAFGLATVPSVRLAPIIGEQGFLLLHRIVSLVLQGASMIAAQYLCGEPLAMVIAFSLAGTLLNIVLILILLGSTTIFDRNRKPL